MRGRPKRRWIDAMKGDMWKAGVEEGALGLGEMDGYVAATPNRDVPERRRITLMMMVIINLLILSYSCRTPRHITH